MASFVGFVGDPAKAKSGSSLQRGAQQQRPIRQQHVGGGQAATLLLVRFASHTVGHAAGFHGTRVPRMCQLRGTGSHRVGHRMRSPNEKGPRFPAAAASRRCRCAAAQRRNARTQCHEIRSAHGPGSRRRGCRFRFAQRVHRIQICGSGGIVAGAARRNVQRQLFRRPAASRNGTGQCDSGARSRTPRSSSTLDVAGSRSSSGRISRRKASINQRVRSATVVGGSIAHRIRNSAR